MHLEYLIYAVVALTAAKFLVVVTQTFVSPLRTVKGPFLARFTNLWYFRRVANGSFEFENIDLHQKYGPVVRLAPNMYSIDDAEVIKAVYSISSKFPKSDWYDAWKHPDPARWSLFAVRDMKTHAEERRKFQALYSLTSLVHYEPYVNECLELFDQRMKEIANAGQTVNMAHWVQCYAFDVIAGLTYSKRFGFLDAGIDVDGLMAMLADVLRYGTLMGIYAWLHPILWPISSRIPASGAGARARLNACIQKWMEEKTNAQDVEKLTEKTAEHTGPQDFLEKVLIARNKEPEKITNWNVFMVGLSNIAAGSDTTASSISGILYHLLKNPDKLQKLRDEMDEFAADGRLSSPVLFKETQTMPYLQAVLKEGLRVHSAVGLPLWRVVPEEGLDICGHFFPPGTIVGLNAWCAHYTADIFEDPYAFRPERWMEADTEKLKQMEGYYLPVSATRVSVTRGFANSQGQFGLGSRTCIGRHISTLEMSKLIPELLRSYDLELAEEKQWETMNLWFVRPEHFSVKVKVR